MSNDPDNIKKVHHYRRPTPQARYKVLIAETVTADSETAQFLKKLEHRRLARPCHQTIDMRGRVPGQCREINYNNRKFHLDDVSNAIFEEGLEKHRGVFTVGTFEAIVNGDHTNKAIRERNERESRERAERSVPETRQTNAAVATDVTGDAGRRDDTLPGKPRAEELYQPAVIPFGYFRRRGEDRLLYADTVEISIGTTAFSASTRDISPGGLRIIIKGLPVLEADAEYAVRFTGMQEKEGQDEPFVIAYRAVEVMRREDSVIVRLARVAHDPQDAFSQAVRGLIDKYRSRYKLDPEDDFITNAAWLYEKLYTESLPHLPFFMARDESGKTVTRAAALTDGNLTVTEFFKDAEHNYDLSPLCLPGRVEHFVKTGDALLAMFRHADADGHRRIYSLADFEAADSAHFSHFISLALMNEDHLIAKIIVSEMPMTKLGAAKIDIALSRLAEKSAEGAAQMQAMHDSVMAMGLLVDITDRVDEIYPQQEADAGMDELMNELSCWVGDAWKTIDQHIADKGEHAGAIPAPGIARFGYTERRREDRFIAKSTVEVIDGDLRESGKTVDISTRGLRVVVGKYPNISPGAKLGVNFIGLQKKGLRAKIDNVSYKLVKVRRGDLVTLHLEREVNRTESALNEFFVDLINQNKRKLGIDIGELVYVAEARLLEGLCVANLRSVPFMLARQESGGIRLQCVMMPEKTSSLAEFFRDGHGDFDFSILSSSKIIVPLYTGLSDIQRNDKMTGTRSAPVSFELYFCRATDPHTGMMTMRAVDEQEFRQSPQPDAIVDAAIQSGEYRLVKIFGTYTLELNKRDQDAAIEEVRRNSKHKALELGEMINAVIGFGELVDISP